MAKMSKEEIARREGVAYAYALARDKGLDALREDIKWRGITDCPIGVDKKDANEWAMKVRYNTVDVFMIMTAVVLQDEFGFGKKRVQQFIDRFQLKADVLTEDYASIDDYKEQLNRELRIDLNIRANDKDTPIKPVRVKI